MLMCHFKFCYIHFSILKIQKDKNMNNTSLLFALFSIISTVVVGQKLQSVDINTDISKVTVYLSGAEISRNYQAQLNEGLNELRFHNISAKADSRSIQFEMEQAADLLSITMESDYLKKQEDTQRIASVRDSIQLLSAKSQQIQDEISALQTEKNVLSTNRNIKGDNVSLTVEQIQSTAKFYRERSLAINTSISEKERNFKRINSQVSKLKQQLKAYNYKENARNNVIVILVESNAPLKLEGQLKYNVAQAGWAPNYDLIAEDISGGIELKYKAKVFNNTGNNWNNVDVHLSTGDPNLSASVPELDPWRLNYQQLDYNYRSKGKMNYQVPQAQSRKKTSQKSERSDKGLNGQGRIQNRHTGNMTGVNDTPEMRRIEVSELSTEFDIDRKYSIPSNAKPYIVEITEYELDASFAHIAIPKLEKDAFLLAKITGWEQLDLVPGPSNIYFNQTYVGESYIDTRNVEDTLGLSFGRDDKILVTRKRVEDFSSKSIIGNSKKDTYAYEIIVKNNRSRTIDLELIDQIPISTNSDIDVAVDELSNAQYDEATGELQWNINAEPGEAQNYKIAFTIKYPKDKHIQVKKFRTVSAPSF